MDRQDKQFSGDRSKGFVESAVVTAVVVLALALVVVPAAATTARVLALGGDASYFEDTSGVLRWYGSLCDYPNLAVLELADIVESGDAPGNLHGLPGHGGGAHFSLDDAGRWGTAAFYVEDDLPAENSGGAFTAMWARSMGRVQAGLFGRFTTFGVAHVASDAGDHGRSDYMHHYGLGLRVDLGEDLYADLAGELINSMAESMDAMHHLRASDEWSSYGLRVRVFKRLNEMAALVPVIDHLTDVRAVHAAVLDGPADRNARLTTFGLGLNLMPDADNLVVISAEFRSGREDHCLRASEALTSLWDVSNRDFKQIRGRVGVESRVQPWLTVRAAFQYIRGDEEIRRYTTLDHENLDDEDVATPISLGIGLHLGSFDADFVHNDSTPVNPGLQAEGLYAADRDGFTSLSILFSF